MKAITAATMRNLDHATISAGTPGEVLMERAGLGCFRELMMFCEGLLEEHCQRFLVLCGKGNNGGDGYVVARYLAEAELQVSIISTCEIEELGGDALLNANRLPEDVEVHVLPEDLAPFLGRGTIIVDALLGTGIQGAVREPYTTIIEHVNASGLPCIAVDIPSGLNADTGEVGNVAIQADLTVTMGQPKTGLLQNQGDEHTGLLRIVDIGILPELVEQAESTFDATTASDIAPWITRLPKTTHKGNMGRIAVVGGSNFYPGALILAGTAAARSGGGLITIVYPESVGPILPSRPAALIMHPLPDKGAGVHGLEAITRFRELLKTQDVIVLGPGIGPAPDTSNFVAEVLGSQRPTVLDADGLRVAEVSPNLFPLSAPTVLTPHPGEMRRLLESLGLQDQLAAGRHTQAIAAAERTNAVVVLKGAHTVIAAPDGRLSVNTSGTPALATGGSGDVLSGMIGAWMAQVGDPFDAARIAVYLHGAAAELGSDSMRAFIPDDLLNLIGPTMANLAPLA